MSDSLNSFWPHAGYAQLKKDANGHLTVTDDFLRVLLLRPELAPIETSCAQEIAVHDRLLEDPRQAITPGLLVLSRAVALPGHPTHRPRRGRNHSSRRPRRDRNHSSRSSRVGRSSFRVGRSNRGSPIV
jgi:hypothetical protein